MNEKDYDKIIFEKWQELKCSGIGWLLCYPDSNVYLEDIFKIFLSDISDVL